MSAPAPALNLCDVAEMVSDHDAVQIICFQPHLCTKCQKMTCIYVNRDGRTVCANCDREER